MPDNEEDDEYDMIYGEACYPYWHFIGAEDRWLPSTDSFKKAKRSKFEGCAVRFLHSGQLLVPWTMAKFKDEIKKFAQEYELTHPKKVENKTELSVIGLTSEQFKKVMSDDESEE